MQNLEAAERIVDIQTVLAEQFLGTPKRAELMTEQTRLWDEFYQHQPFEVVQKDAWMHKVLFKYG